MVARQDFGIDIPSPPVSLLAVRAILEGNEEAVAEYGLVNLNRTTLSLQLETKVPVANVPLVGPFVREKGGVVSWVVDVENRAINGAVENIVGIEGVIRKTLKRCLLIWRERRAEVVLEKLISLLPPFQDLFFLERGNRFFLTLSGYGTYLE